MLEHYVWKIFVTNISFIGFILLYYLLQPFRVPTLYFCFRVEMSLRDGASNKRKGEKETLERQTGLSKRT